MSFAERPDSVRLSMPSDAGAITAIQRARMSVDPALAPILADYSEQDMIQTWNDAIVAPPLATFRVLVAQDATETCGFAVIGPSDDEDADPTDAVVAEFCIHPDYVRAGHEDRLMHAIVDTMRADGFERATWWVRSIDDETREWLREQGWENDGAYREIGDEAGRTQIKQLRMHTSLV